MSLPFPSPTDHATTRAQVYLGYLDYFRSVLVSKLVLVSVNRHGEPANYDSYEPAISGDGRAVAYRSAASNLVQRRTHGQFHVYTWARSD